jgi:S-adenosylmethionine decarboxylase
MSSLDLPHAQVDPQVSAPFEGPEKLLEIWFAPSADHVERRHGQDGNFGLRAVPRQTWEDMLRIVKCKVLSVLEGTEMDAYLLRSAQAIRRLFLSQRHI